MSVTGEGPGREPVKVGAPVSDITAGILAAFGVASALLARERTGVGRRVDTSLFEAGVTLTYWQSAIALASGTSPGPLGSAHPLSAPYQAFGTADGWVNVGASNPSTWSSLVEAIGAPNLALDGRFATNAARMANLETLAGVLTPIFRSRPTDDWLATLSRHGVPAGPIASVGEMLDHPQTRAREMVVEVQHPKAGRVRSLGNPVKLSSADRGATDSEGSGGAWAGLPAPLLGQHTEAVLRDAGFTAEEVTALQVSGAVLQGDDGAA